MKLIFGSQIIQSYKRLSYTAWYALAEFVDNSTESFLVNKERLTAELGDKAFQVNIDYDGTNKLIRITDNAMGMSKEELENALMVGQRPVGGTGRSQYGLGLKTAASWLGNRWTVRTKKLGEKDEHFIVVDVDSVASNNTDLPYEVRRDLDENLHYTIIEISELNRLLYGKTQAKIKNYLRSMYRRDFEKHNLKLYWDDVLLTWDYQKMIWNKLHKNRNGDPTMKEFQFTLGEGEDVKTVTGWAGVFEHGSRLDAGFSLIQADRVIRGWPDAYKPESVFGENRNDLVNQRLVGEIFLEGFFVSHTKDAVIFENEDQDDFEERLAEEVAGLKRFANEYRKYLDDERTASPDRSGKALNEFKEELDSPLLRDKVAIGTVPPQGMIRQVNSGIISLVKKRMPVSLEANIDDLHVSIYVDSKLSPNDPYVLVEIASNRSELVIIINSSHPHWTYLTSSSDILNFIRHSTYDGVAEWKAMAKLDRLDSDTIKYIKDELLRVPFEIEQRD